MRIVDNIHAEKIKITVFDWQGRYIVQCEDRGIMISFKYAHTDFSLTDVKALFDERRVEKVYSHLLELHSLFNISHSPNSDIDFEDII